ncbi:hypothetical protein KDA_00220 [Dictyobacter alpinus]|uniref:Uncharacterized protein n=1 Tax=Dictyobacter alpinus TaxID=2014873 RepID=A0A402AZN0_9CHLR|nr:hypothetical protein [Dictyobacter alpinus]GCE24538.1 hypothetical protein KDA_00220 [Dictyobacter alpinus]
MIQTSLKGYSDIKSLRIDTWRVDFGFLNSQGEPLSNPYHYRDAYTSNMMKQVFQQVTQAEIFSHTGIQFISFNTIYQLAALRLADSSLLKIENLVQKRFTGRYVVGGGSRIRFYINIQLML